MKSLKLLYYYYYLVLYFAIFLLFAAPTICQPDFPEYDCGSDNYTKKSQFRKNLDVVLTSITSNTHIDYGFYNLSVGQKLDIVNGIALCRGDLPTPDCKTCIQNATTNITSLCPNQKAGIIWYETCMLYYSSQNIFKGHLSLPSYSLVHSGNASNPKSYNKTVSGLMTRLAKEAAVGDFRRKYATGEVNVSNGVSVYGLVQCVPDMEDFDCLNCLNLAINYTLADCCYAHRGVEAAGISCSIRFDNHKFYKTAAVLPPLQSSASPPFLSSLPPPPPLSISRKTGNRNKRIKVAVGITIPTLALITVIAVVFMGCYIKTRQSPIVKTHNDEEDEENEMADSLLLDFNIIKSATNNFSNSNKLGQGGFGTIYKGIIASTGQVIAVKRLSKNNSGGGENEFLSEALLQAKLQHRNLVKCLGYSQSKDERLLVYEFLPNKSLDLFLFDPIKRLHLQWEKRYNIILGIARGLLYLHEESRLLVVHRDLKPSNVLLDADMNPKISDFGMARLFGADESHANTSKIAGTYGYMPPEYVVHGHFSIKTDVFSFGVLVLELITGHKVSELKNGESLLSFAWREWSQGNALKLVDTSMSDVNIQQVLRCINIGMLCVQENAARRPIMSSLVLMLNSHSVSYPMPSRPAFLVQNGNDVSLTKVNTSEPGNSINEASESSIAPR